MPDEYLADALPIAKRIAIAQGAENYNILQNNGRIAHQVREYNIRDEDCNQDIPQEVDHVHIHVIPKPSASDKEGLVLGWPTQTLDKTELQKVFEEIKGKL